MNPNKYEEAYKYMLKMKHHTLRQDLITHVYNIITSGDLSQLQAQFTDSIITSKFISQSSTRVSEKGIENAYTMANRIANMILINLGKIITKMSFEKYQRTPPFLQSIIRSYIGRDNEDSGILKIYFEAYHTKDYRTLYSLLKTNETQYNPHQTRVRDFFLKYKPRYGILYHEMGSGKTCTATALISAISTLTDVETVYILVPNAYLVKQFAEDFEYTCSFIYGQIWDRKDDDSIVTFKYNHQTYYIITYITYSKFTNVKPNSVMIIDEAHNIRSTNDITKIEGSTSSVPSSSSSSSRNSQSGVELHQSIFSKILTNDMSFQHVFFMTGTPVMNIPNDFIVLLNAMLLLTCQGDKMITRANNAEYKALMANTKPNTFFDNIPRLLGIIDTTLRNTRGFVSRVRVQDMASTLKLPSIDFSNHYYNYSSDFTGSIRGEIPYDVLEKYNTGIRSSPIPIEMTPSRYNELMALRTPEGEGRTHNESSVQHIDTLSWGTKDNKIHKARILCNKDKIIPIVTNVMKHLQSSIRSPVLIHTIPIETVSDIEAELKRNNFVPFDNKQVKESLTYAIISGKVSDAKVAEIMMAYNNIANIKGDIISVCIITSAAGTGFTFRNTREMHIVEPYWNFSYLQQVTGRAVRHNVFNEYISDVDGTIKPAHVKIYAYLAIAPSSIKQYKTIDEEILEMMRDKMRYVETYSSLLYKLSLEYPRNESNARNFYDYPASTDAFVCTKEIKLIKSVKKMKQSVEPSTEPPTSTRKQQGRKKSLFLSPENKNKSIAPRNASRNASRNTRMSPQSTRQSSSVSSNSSVQSAYVMNTISRPASQNSNSNNDNVRMVSRKKPIIVSDRVLRSRLGMRSLSSESNRTSNATSSETSSDTQVIINEKRKRSRKNIEPSDRVLRSRNQN